MVGFDDGRPLRLGQLAGSVDGLDDEQAKQFAAEARGFGIHCSEQSRAGQRERARVKLEGRAKACVRLVFFFMPSCSSLLTSFW